MHKILFALIVVLLLGIGSCNKDNSDPDPGLCSTAWTTQLSTEINALSAAAQAYGTDPSPANCNAFKAAYQDYLSALQPFTECAAWTEQQKQELQDEIDDAQAQIDTLCE